MPAALQGIDITKLLSGACEIDTLTRNTNVKDNPALQLALALHASCNGKVTKNMAVLHYKDRLELFSRYLQQLVMESLGKELDLNGNVVIQGLTVFGNKGSTDQRAYVQQLRDGPNDFFVTFIEVLNDGQNSDFMVENNVATGDFLHGFFLGTREALAEKIIKIQGEILSCLSSKPGKLFTVTEISQIIHCEYDIETISKVIQHLTANQNRRIVKAQGRSFLDSKYGLG